MSSRSLARRQSSGEGGGGVDLWPEVAHEDERDCLPPDPSSVPHHMHHTITRK